MAILRISSAFVIVVSPSKKTNFYNDGLEGGMQRSYYVRMELLKRMIPFFISIALAPVGLAAQVASLVEGYNTDDLIMPITVPYTSLFLVIIEKSVGFKLFFSSGCTTSLFLVWLPCNSPCMG